jgi:hypothetical protein
MTALDTVDYLVAQSSLSRKKDILTSLRKLALALDVPLQTLDLALIEHTYRDTLTSYFASVNPPASIHTQRNTVQNLKQLFRAAHDAGLLQQSPPFKRLTIQEAMATASQSAHYRVRTSNVMSRYLVPVNQWPAELREPWEAYTLERQFDLRDTTLRLYEKLLTPYVSFGLRCDASPLTTWNQLFDIARLRRFIAWHATRVDESWTREMGEPPESKTRITHTGTEASRVVAMLALYLKRPEATALGVFCKKLPDPAPWHHKTAPIHTISLRELDEVGVQMIAEAKAHVHRTATYRKAPGLFRAITYQTGLLIRLWWRVPLRNRAMREMDMPLPGESGDTARLYWDASGTWQIRYQGEQLKVSRRRGRTNDFRVPFPPELVPNLEEYLTDFRPLIPHATTTRWLFLSRNGQQLNQSNMWWRLFYPVYRRTGKRVFPHLLRQKWTDSYLLTSGGDIDTAAYMLNDSPTTMLTYYHELIGDQQVPKAYAFNQAILGNGNGKGHRRP